MCFLLNLAKFRRTPFLQNTSGRLLLPLAFRQQPPKLCYKRAVLENFATFIEKHLWFVKSLRTLFLLNTSAAATLLKSGTANSVRKTLDEYYLSRSTVKVLFRNITSFSAAIKCKFIEMLPMMLLYLFGLLIL